MTPTDLIEKKATKTLKAVIYVRVSSDEQAKKEFSIPKIQIPECMSFIEKNNWLFSKTYVDEGKDCNSFKKRTALQQMLVDDIDNYDVVVIYSFDRLSGDDQNTSGQIYNILDKNRKQVTAVKQPIQIYSPEEYDPKSLQVAQARQINNFGVSWDRKIRRERFMDSIKKTVENGRPVSGPPYGYKIIREIHPKDNTRTIGYRVIDEEEAPILRRIFRERSEGKSVEHITGDLNREGMKTRRGCLWSNARIYQVLKNPFPAGIFIRHRYKERKFGDDNVVERFPEDQWQFIPINREIEKHYKPLISKELFERVKRISKINKTFERKAIGSGSLLSGLGRCPKCGSPMFESSYYRTKNWPYCQSYFVCSSWTQKRDCSNTRKYPAWKVKKRLVQEIMRYANDPEAFNKYQKKARKKKMTARKNELALYEKKIKKLDERIYSLNLKYVDEKIKYNYYNNLLMELESERKKLNKNISDIRREIEDFVKSRQKINEIKDLNKFLYKNFARLSKEKKKSIIRDLVEEIVYNKETDQWDVLFRN